MPKKYRYAGKAGGFVPGLPQEIDENEAKERGLDKLLAECIAAGLYKEKKPAKKKENKSDE
jgi:hypothetical protein